MRPLTFSMPFLPPSLNLCRNDHWRRQREDEKTWKDFIAVKWAELGKPKLAAVRITVIFSFHDRKTRNLDNYFATGGKLVGDAVKGRFIPDDSPEHLTAWCFRFEFGDEAKTTVVIEEAGRAAEGPGGPSSENRPDCALYETCLAPLCPLDRISLKGVWYPDEEICRSRTHGNLSWIKAQRKITKAATTGYFTLEILNSIRTIRKGITGLDPNVDEKPQLVRWLDLHERKRSDFGGRQNSTLVFETGKAEPDGPSTRSPAGPKKGVSAPLQNMAKRGGQGKNLCRNGGSQHPNRIGTGKPPSLRFAPSKTVAKG